MYTLLIKNGKVIDGSGSSGFIADIAIKGKYIEAVKPDICEEAEHIIDADGLVVSPGFIDIHSHTDATIFYNPLSNSKLLQGVTSEVIGNCGVGLFPVNPLLRNELEEYVKTHSFKVPSEGISWTDLQEYTNVLNEVNPSVNLLPLVPHGILRSAVVGFEDRKATPAELEKMKELLKEALSQGAWGISAGLIYPPGSFADTDELVELAKILPPFDGIFSFHIRGESSELLNAINETIYIGKKSGAKIQISHLKAMGKPQWGLGKKLLKMISKAREEGVNIGADQYPYAASSTALTALVPRWAHSGGIGKLLERLQDAELLPGIKNEISEEMSIRGGPDCVLIVSTATDKNSICNGKTIDALAREWGMDPVDAVIKLLIEEKCAVGAVYFSMLDDDVKTILADKTVSIGSDGWGMSVENDNAKAVHPRSYGTFPKVLGQFVREEKLLSLETAIYKMTGLTAKRLGLKDRGILRQGFAADITIFDPNTVIDNSAFTNPHQYPEGIEYVIVNGQIAVKNGKLTGSAPGEVLLKK